MTGYMYTPTCVEAHTDVMEGLISMLTHLFQAEVMIRNSSITIQGLFEERFK